METSGKITNGISDDALGIGGRRSIIAAHIELHGVLVAIMAALGDDGVELIEIAPLNRVQARGDIVQFGVFRCIGFDLRHAAFGMVPPALKRGPIALAPERSEEHTSELQSLM